LLSNATVNGLTFKMGQTHVHGYLPELLRYIEEDKLRPADIIAHRMSLEDAAKGYEIFNNKEEDCRKVVLTPGIDASPAPRH